MLNLVNPKLLLAGWFLAVVGIVAWSMGMDARLSTSALLLAMGVAPGIVYLLLQAGAPAPTVAEILHTANATNGRS